MKGNAMTKTRLILLAVASAALTVTAGAAANDNSGTETLVCISPAGYMRIPGAGECKRREIAFVLPTGAQGPAGVQGPAGAAGRDGVDGRDGRDGLDGLDLSAEVAALQSQMAGIQPFDSAALEAKLASKASMDELWDLSSRARREIEALGMAAMDVGISSSGDFPSCPSLSQYRKGLDSFGPDAVCWGLSMLSQGTANKAERVLEQNLAATLDGNDGTEPQWLNGSAMTDLFGTLATDTEVAAAVDAALTDGAFVTMSELDAQVAELTQSFATKDDLSQVQSAVGMLGTQMQGLVFTWQLDELKDSVNRLSSGKADLTLVQNFYSDLSAQVSSKASLASVQDLATYLQSTKADTTELTNLQSQLEGSIADTRRQLDFTFYYLDSMTREGLGVPGHGSDVCAFISGDVGYYQWLANSCSSLMRVAQTSIDEAKRLVGQNLADSLDGDPDTGSWDALFASLTTDQESAMALNAVNDQLAGKVDLAYLASALESAQVSAVTFSQEKVDLAMSALSMTIDRLGALDFAYGPETFDCPGIANNVAAGAVWAEMTCQGLKNLGDNVIEAAYQLIQQDVTASFDADLTTGSFSNLVDALATDNEVAAIAATKADNSLLTGVVSTLADAVRGGAWSAWGDNPYWCGMAPPPGYAEVGGDSYSFIRMCSDLFELSWITRDRTIKTIEGNLLADVDLSADSSGQWKNADLGTRLRAISDAANQMSDVQERLAAAEAVVAIVPSKADVVLVDELTRSMAWVARSATRMNGCDLGPYEANLSYAGIDTESLYNMCTEYTNMMWAARLSATNDVAENLWADLDSSAGTESSWFSYSNNDINTQLGAEVRKIKAAADQMDEVQARLNGAETSISTLVADMPTKASKTLVADLVSELRYSSTMAVNVVAGGMTPCESRNLPSFVEAGIPSWEMDNICWNLISIGQMARQSAYSDVMNNLWADLDSNPGTSSYWPNGGLGEQIRRIAGVADQMDDAQSRISATEALVFELKGTVDSYISSSQAQIASLQSENSELRQTVCALWQAGQYSGTTMNQVAKPSFCP